MLSIKKYATNIQYVNICSRPVNFQLPFIEPEEIPEILVDFIKRCPKDILQLDNGIKFQHITKRLHIYKGFDFLVLYSDNIDKYSTLFNKDQIRLLLIDINLKDLDHVIETILKFHDDKQYYFFYSKNASEKKRPPHIENLIDEPNTFITTLINNQSLILPQYSEQLEAPSIPVGAKPLKGSYFVPSHNNYRIANLIAGNFFEPESDKNEKELIKKESLKAHKSPYSFDRQKIFVTQIDKIDKLANYLNGEESTNQTFPYYLPLILIAPFHNPDIKDFILKKEDSFSKDIQKIYKLEQTSNYVTISSDKYLPKEITVAGLLFAQKKITYLDSVSFLHASITNSPIVRLPYKSKSLYKLLQPFTPEQLTAFERPNTRKKITRLIERFGSNYVKECISEQLKKTIKKKNRQIVAISDLPIEWLYLDGVPLAFSHDVCRIPETPLSLSMQSYMVNNNIEFKIESNIIHKTLVILGSEDKHFLPWQEQTIKLSQELKFKVARCRTIKDVSDAINKHKPNLLIFDCHGGYDKTSKSTYLYIGKEKLTDEKITEYQISSPIVFLSACNTYPTFGTTNSIANAFFQNGCLSITTSYLPIEVVKGGILYLRLLAKLNQASSQGLHKNWLEFISHITRTSLISDIFFSSKRKHQKKDSVNYSLDTHTNYLNDSLFFSKRRELYKRAISRLNTGENNNEIPEHLFYSHLGRPDLISFDEWEKEWDSL